MRNATRLSKIDQPAQLDPLVASHTGVWRSAASIAMKKILDDAAAKVLATIDNLIGHVQLLRNKPRDPDFTTAPFLPFLRGSHCFVFVLPHLEGHTMDVITLAYQQGCRHRAVYSTTHTQKNGWTFHTERIVLIGDGKG